MHYWGFIPSKNRLKLYRFSKRPPISEYGVCVYMSAITAGQLINVSGLCGGMENVSYQNSRQMNCYVHKLCVKRLMVCGLLIKIPPF